MNTSQKKPEETLDYIVSTTSMKNMVKLWGHEMDTFITEWDGCHDHCLLAAPAVDETVRKMWQKGLFVYATFHDDTCPNRGWRVVINEQGAKRVQGGDASLQRAEELGFFNKEEE